MVSEDKSAGQMPGQNTAAAGSDAAAQSAKGGRKRGETAAADIFAPANAAAGNIAAPYSAPAAPAAFSAAAAAAAVSAAAAAGNGGANSDNKAKRPVSPAAPAIPPSAAPAVPPSAAAPSAAAAPDSAAAAEAAGKDTPMMAQYFKIKNENPGFLLFYRMGDFYELFFEDALVASRILDITLTARGKRHGADIPMCGVPVFAAEDYLQKLIAANCRIAVCEQMEDPAEARRRGAKSVVRREVIRRVTPGTITEDKLLAAERGNYLMAVIRAKAPAKGEAEPGFALAWADISTGVFRVALSRKKSLLSDILRVEPQELLMPQSLFEDPELRPLFDIIGKAAAPQPNALFEAGSAGRRIGEYYNIAALDGLADFSKAELQAIAAVLAYVEKTQIHGRPPLERPAREDKSQYVFIDAATAANLELIRTLSGKAEGSLLKAVNRTLTGGGARLLAERLSAPLSRARPIEERLDSVAFFLQNPDLAGQLREQLKGLADIMRALSRLSLERGGPRDFAALLHAQESARAICHIFAPANLPDELAEALEALADLPQDLRERLKAALADELPLLKRDGGFIRRGFNAELDELRSLKTETHRIIAAMQRSLAEETGIKNLKIRHNNILGFFIEVSTAQAGPLHESAAAKARFIHRQSMANAMRFTTAELAELETRINSAAGGALAIELRLYDELTAMVKAHAEDLRLAARALAVLDVSAALAALAEEQGYCRPAIDESLDLEIIGGRHPVVEQALRAQAAGSFIANACVLSPPGNAAAGAAANRPIAEKHGAGRKAAAEPGGIWLLTGPNMGGKSTFLRQNALIVLMAQMGSFVPAGSARIGLVNRLFSRVGASDDLARGRSTFMVEMVETAAILNQADEKSLVILDEIGRGTATFDGLSIAWAVLEYLHNVNRCRAVFATHFHELTALAAKLPRLSNHTMKVREWHNEVIFLHEVGAGAADRSYGVQVARLAGLPPAVTERARAVLAQLENQALTAKTEDILEGLPLFSSAGAQTGGHNAATEMAAAQQAAAEAVPEPFKTAAASLSGGGPQAAAAEKAAAAPAPALTAAEQQLLAALEELDPDSLTPRAALEEIYRLKALLTAHSRPGPRGAQVNN